MKSSLSEGSMLNVMAVVFAVWTAAAFKFGPLIRDWLSPLVLQIADPAQTAYIVPLVGVGLWGAGIVITGAVVMRFFGVRPIERDEVRRRAFRAGLVVVAFLLGVIGSSVDPQYSPYFFYAAFAIVLGLLVAEAYRGSKSMVRRAGMRRR